TAHVALIARNGARWFRELGTSRHPGSALVTLKGAVDRPGVYEIALGTPIAQVIQGAGGRQQLRALLVGGFHGSWLTPDALATTSLDNDSLREFGATLGAGVLVALPAAACPVAEVAPRVTWMAGESAGQCGPCIHGLEAISGAFAAVAAGKAEPDAAARLMRWSAQVQGPGACH